MPDGDEDDRSEWVRRVDLENLIGIAEIEVMLSRGRRRVMYRSQAQEIVTQPSFPAPLVTYPRTGRVHVRLWLLADVEPWIEEWLDRTRPGWRYLPPPAE